MAWDMKNVVALLAMGALVLAFACEHRGGECGYGEGCVTEKTRRLCAGPFVESRIPGERETCPEGSRCIENYRSSGQVYAACAIGDIDPKCNRDEDISYCDGNTWVRCKGHFREETFDCADEVCAELGPRAKCVRSLDHDAHCSADAGPLDRQRAFCDGESLFGCFGPFAKLVTQCAAEGKFCRVVAAEGACRLQSEPDPGCDDLKKPHDMYCDGDVAVLCTLGWREDTIDCAAQGKRCVQTRDPNTNVATVRCVEP